MLARLDRAVSRVAPIFGVAIGRRDDKSTWRVDFQDEATPEQRAAAQGVIAGFDADAPDVPQSVTPYQARMALLGAGLLPAVEAMMADPATDPAARIAWEYATVFERHSPFISALAPALDLTEQDVDNLFIAAGRV